MENMKFWVESPEECEAVQKKLFEMGFGWGGHRETTVQYTHANCLFASGSCITYAGNDATFFAKHENIDTDVDEFLGNPVEEDNEEVEKGAIVQLSNIFGKLYETHEVFHALKSLKTYTI